VLVKKGLTESPFVLEETMSRHIPECRDKRCTGCGSEAPLRKRIKELERFVKDCRDNFDHEDDAHKYGYADSQCRCCMAEKLIGKKK
jgi:hypothetical protein